MLKGGGEEDEEAGRQEPGAGTATRDVQQGKGACETRKMKEQSHYVVEKTRRPQLRASLCRAWQD